MNLSEITEVDANSISDNEINASGDLDSDVNKSNVLKQVPKMVSPKGGNLKPIFQRNKCCPWILTLVFVH